MTVTNSVFFTEDDVEDWCIESGDSNPLHLDEEAAENHALFDERIVPGMMLLDQVSGLITQWSEKEGGTPVLSRVSGVKFKEPVPLHKWVDVSVEVDDVEDGVYILFFEVEADDTSFAHGHATVHLL